MKKQLLFVIAIIASVEETYTQTSKTTQNRIISLMKDYQNGETAGLQQAFIKTPNDFIDWKTAGYTPNALMYAVYEGNHYPKVVQFLTQQPFIKQHINDQNKNGSTALHMAVQQKNLENIKTLVSAGINTSIKNKSKLTAFAFANKRKGYTAVANTLKSLGITK